MCLQGKGLIVSLRLTGLDPGPTGLTAPENVARNPGWTAAVAAYGAFIAPVVIGAQIKAGTPEYSMYGFAIFYALCLILNWWFYLRGNAYVKNP